MVKTTSIAVLAQFRFVKPCANCPMFKRWSLLVLFVILWARPPRLSECLSLQCPSRWGRSKAHRAPLGHRFTNLPVLVLVEACPPSPRSQPRPAPAPLFCAAPSLAICPPFGFPRRRRLRRSVASKGASLRRRRLRRRVAAPNRPNAPRPPPSGWSRHAGRFNARSCAIGNNTYICSRIRAEKSR